MQGWDYVPPKAASETISRTRSVGATAALALAASTTGVVDLSQVIVPLVEESRVWISLHAREFFRVSMIDALTMVGGTRLLRPFSREIGERDPKAMLRSLRNCIMSQPLNAILTGRARAFSPSTISTTMDQVWVSPDADHHIDVIPFH